MSFFIIFFLFFRRFGVFISCFLSFCFKVGLNLFLLKWKLCVILLFRFLLFFLFLCDGFVVKFFFSSGCFKCVSVLKSSSLLFLFRVKVLDFLYWCNCVLVNFLIFFFLMFKLLLCLLNCWFKNVFVLSFVSCFTSSVRWCFLIVFVCVCSMLFCLFFILWLRMLNFCWWLIVLNVFFIVILFGLGLFVLLLVWKNFCFDLLLLGLDGCFFFVMLWRWWCLRIFVEFMN